MTATLDVALVGDDVGLCVIPASTDGSKRPAGRWRQYEIERPSRETLIGWFGDGHPGLGVVCGAVSGNLEMLEFEGRAVAEGVLDCFMTAADAAGLASLFDRITTGYCERTPSGGLHLLYRCPDGVDRNLKLARRPATADELDETPGDKVKVLIETRGEGGFTITAPSNGTTHPTGGAWELLHGGFTTIASITGEERRALLELARSFDKPAEPAAPPRPPVRDRLPLGDDARPGDEFAQTCDDVLLAAGFAFHHEDQGGRHYTRPGKATREGSSATVWKASKAGGDRLTLFSSSIDAPLEYLDDKRALTAWQAHVALHHGGDHAAAAAAWRQSHPHPHRANRHGPSDSTLSPPSSADEPGPTDPGEMAQPSASASSWLPVDLGPALRGEQTAPEPGILARTDGLGLFYPGKCHVLAGEPESGKSWLAQLATAIILMAGGKVVYVDFEDDAAGVVGRLRALGVSVDQILAGFTYLRPDEALGESGHLLDQACAGAQLAVLDGVTEAMAVHGWAPKNDIDVALFQARILRRMAASGAAVAVIDHVVKNANDRGKWATGSQHKLAGVDGAQYLVEVIKPWAPGRSGLAAITVTKDRPGRVRAGLDDLKTVGIMVVTCWPDGGIRIDLQPPLPVTFTVDGQPRPTILMEKVSKYLAAHTDEDLSGRQILGDVKGDDKALRRALKVLVEEGYVTRVDQGQAQYHRLAKPYDQAADPAITGQQEGEENA